MVQGAGMCLPHFRPLGHTVDLLTTYLLRWRELRENTPRPFIPWGSWPCHCHICHILWIRIGQDYLRLRRFEREIRKGIRPKKYHKAWRLSNVVCVNRDAVSCRRLDDGLGITGSDGDLDALQPWPHGNRGPWPFPSNKSDFGKPWLLCRHLTGCLTNLGDRLVGSRH